MQILNRHIAVPLHRALQDAPAVALTGPRRAGKAALARREFPGHTYVNLQDAADRRRARAAPAAFLGALRGRAIIDEAHRAPELLGQLEAATSLLLLAPVRLGLPEELHLFPLSLAEREQRPPASLSALARYPQPRTTPPRVPLETLLAGGTRDEESLARDARALVGLQDEDQFLRLAHLAAGASGAVVDQSEWARQCGVTHTTIGRWLDALERAFFLVQPRAWPETFGKRLVRRRKLFWLDPAWVPTASAFTTWVVAEIVKGLAHTAQPFAFWHWLTATGRETGLVVDTEAGPVSVSFTRLPAAPPAMIQAAGKWRALAPHHAACVFVCGAERATRQGVAVLPWWCI